VRGFQAVMDRLADPASAEGVLYKAYNGDWAGVAAAIRGGFDVNTTGRDGCVSCVAASGQSPPPLPPTLSRPLRSAPRGRETDPLPTRACCLRPRSAVVSVRTPLRPSLPSRPFPTAAGTPFFTTPCCEGTFQPCSLRSRTAPTPTRAPGGEKRRCGPAPQRAPQRCGCLLRCCCALDCHRGGACRSRRKCLRLCVFLYCRLSYCSVVVDVM
jgi:hypothetical protein